MAYKAVKFCLITTVSMTHVCVIRHLALYKELQENGTNVLRTSILKRHFVNKTSIRCPRLLICISKSIDCISTNFDLT